ncbi:MAG TPA: secretin N-terminal domain-containing protein [Longimicrobiales bacterium]|nr:secretin N-terminal domain-containing protein [Longimicrobiales bacterium]
MPPLIALLLAAAVAEPQVTGLSVTPVADRTEVVILVDGNVTPRHFMLDDGRIVVDLNGVSRPPNVNLRNFNRGGVRELRVAPFQPNVARVVIALDGPATYELVREGGTIRVTFPNRGGAFEAWSQGFGNRATAPSQAPSRVAAPIGAPVAAPAAAAQPVAQEPQAVQQQPGTRPTNPQAQQPGTRPAGPQTQVQFQQPRPRPVTVTFSAEPVNNVLAVFSEYAGRTILAAPDVQSKTVTAELRGVPWDQALEAILEANNMNMRLLNSGVYLVEDMGRAGQRQREEPTVTQAFSIQYISADSIRAAVQGLLTPQVGRVTVNTASNALLVTDTKSSVERIGEIIPQLDARTPQVDISATIAFIDRTALEAYGVVYDLKDRRGSQFNRLVTGFTPDGTPTSDDVVLLDGASIAALGNANHRVQAPALEVVSTIVLGRFSLISFIEALQTVSLSDIQAKPVLRTMDHRLATIQVGEETPIRVIDAGSGAVGAGGAPRATVEYKNTGVILEVTPHITGNQVLLDMRAERSNVATAPGDIGVIFQTQNARTQVLVNDGETVVIGGLTIIEKRRLRAGIPVLMNLPVLGALFRSERTEENKRDLLIMVTPHIVRD